MPRDPAVDIVTALIRDLNGRSGGDHWWHRIEPETQREILRRWRKIVREGMKRAEDPAR